MNCNPESLQAFLDDELSPAEKEAVRRHLGGCPACRRELSRLRLLWLELAQAEEMEIPLELPYIRQHAVNQARLARRDTGQNMAGTPGVSLWDAQKLAWEPVLSGVAQIYGTRQLGQLVRTAGRGLPAVLKGVSSMAGRIIGKGRNRC